jgi:hypothetical protein
LFAVGFVGVVVEGCVGVVVGPVGGKGLGGCIGGIPKGIGGRGNGKFGKVGGRGKFVGGPKGA